MGDGHKNAKDPIKRRFQIYELFPGHPLAPFMMKQTYRNTFAV